MNNTAYCPYCEKLVNTANAVEFNGIEYLDTGIRRCYECTEVFFDSNRGEPAIDFYNHAEEPTIASIAGWGFMAFFGIIGILCFLHQVPAGGIFYFAIAVGILIYKIRKLMGNSNHNRREQLATGKGLPVDVANSLARMNNLEYVEMLQALNISIPEWFINRLRADDGTADKADEGT